MGCPSPHCSRDSYGVTAGPDGSCCPGVAPEVLWEPKPSPIPGQECFTFSLSHVEDCREQEGCSWLHSSLRKPPLLHIQAAAAPSSSPEPGQTWTSRSSTSVGTTKANTPIAEVFNFRKGTTSKVSSCFFFFFNEETGNKEGKIFVGGTELI